MILDLKVSECQCADCQKMCQNSPCMGTPDDIQHLINIGRKKDLTITFWGVLNSIDRRYPIIPMVQIIGTVNPDGKTMTCSLFHEGKCTIHKDKPIGGKTAIHGTDYEKVLARETAIALEWITEKGVKLIDDFL